MAWTTVPTFTSGQILTAAQMNGLGNDLTVLRGDWAISRYTTANRTHNTTSWADLSGPADLVLAAAAGDVVEAGVSALYNNEAVTGFLDVVTIVSSTVTNSFATGGAVEATGQGVMAWRGNEGQLENAGGSMYYKLVSGDIASSTVTLRLRIRCSGASTKTIFAATATPIVFFARNHGPVEI